MTTEYTPSLNEIRADYVHFHTRNHDSYLTGVSLTAAQEVYGDDFDRALATFKRDTEIALLERLADSVRHENGNEVSGHTSTYSIREWLRAKAHELRKEQADDHR